MAENQKPFELIVHIGTGKTGSSSIQKSLYINSKLIKKKGFAYIGLMGEEAPVKLYLWQKAGGWPDLVACGKPRAQEELTEMLTKSIHELSIIGYRGGIWSNETIFGNDEMVIPILQQLEQQGTRIKVIVYIRRHDAWMRSAYLQWGIKHKTYRGPVKSFAEWRATQRINFYGGLKPWLEHQWDDITVRNFDACGDVVADFLEYYDLYDQGIVLRRDNETPNATALALWAIYNSQCEDKTLPVQLQRLLKKAGLLDKEPFPCELAALLPKQEDIDAVNFDSANDRKLINEVFRQFSQPEMEVTPLSVKEMVVTQHHINAALLMMIKQQHDQIHALSKKIAELTSIADVDRI